MTSRWTGSVLDPMRQVCDPLADNLIASLQASGNVQSVNALMRTLVEIDQVPPGQVSPAVLEFLDTSAVLPEWADAGKIKLGERLFWRYGPQMISTLLCYSLPFCYAGAKGVQVLSLTSRLYTNPIRRVIETAQMLVDAMSPGGISNGGKGIRTAQKVRLMHAGVRYQIHQYAGWNPDFGQPINQEDMAGTLISFSWVLLDGFARMGLPVKEEEADAFLHCWNVIGHVLGVRGDMLTTGMADAEALARTIQQRQYASCPEGIQMTDALIKMLQGLIPGNLLDFIPLALTRFLLGDTYSDMLGVGRIANPGLLLLPLRAFDKFIGTSLESNDVHARLCEIFSRRLIDALVRVARGGTRIPFSIPTELRQQWGVNWVP